jgi:thiosulfate/3-mercaptopyruvate sulfurtransferase
LAGGPRFGYADGVMHRDPQVPTARLLRAALCASLLLCAAPAFGAAASRESAKRDSIPVADLIQPDDLARQLTGPAAGRPTLLHVGFERFFRSAHIPGSLYAGPASERDGLASLKRALRPLPRRTEIVLYCGCCPWDVCPNVRPAFRTARELGFRNVRVLMIAKNLKQDWIARKLPVAEGGS